MSQVKLFLIGLPIFLIIDFIWLGVVAKGFYLQQYGSLARRVGDSLAPNWPAGIFVYLLIVLGLVLFVVPKAAASANPWAGLLYGALFGVILYGVYDFTAYSVIANWPLPAAIVDTVWGGVLCGAVGLAMTHIHKLIS